MNEKAKTPEELRAEIVRLEERAKGMDAALAQSFAAFSALQEREERYRLLVENLPDVAWTTDNTGHTVYISPQVEDTYGFTAEEVLAGGDELWFGRIHPDDRARVHAAFEQMMTSGSAFDVEYRIRHKNGEYIWLHDRAFVRSTKEGKRFAHGIFRDITAFKRAEAAVAESEANYRNLFDSSTDGIFLLDLDGKFIDANRTAYERLGYRREEFLALDIRALDDPAFANKVPERLRQIRELGVAVFESGHRRKDGSMMPVEVNSRLFDYHGKQVYFSVVRDITERKRAETERAEAERTLRQLIDAAPFGAHVYDLYGDRLVFTGANRAADRILGIDHTQFIGKTIEDAFPDLKGTNIPAAYRAVAQSGETFEREEFLYKDERISGAFEVIAAQLGKGRMAAFFRDITERKKADDALHREKNKTDAILAALGDGLSVQDREFRVLYQNDAHKAIVGSHAGEFCYAAYQHSPSVCEHCALAMAFEDGKVHTVERVRKTDKGTQYVEITASPLRDADGTIVAGIELVRNVTDRRRAEEDRHRSQEQAQLLIDRMPVGCIMWDTEFRVALWNPAAERIFGYPAFDALGKHAYDLVVPKKARAAVDPVWQRLMEGDQIAHSENANTTRDGRTIMCEWYNTPIRDARGKVSFVLSMVTDVTDRHRAAEERHKLEGQLLQSQKMEAIGLLAGGVAHDFNNILSAILGYASILHMKMRPDDTLRPNVEQVLAASQRAATLTQSLLAFSRKQIINPQALLVNESIRKIEKLLRRVIGEDIEFTSVYGSPDLTVVADAGQLEQVIINLATNARDAMPHGGTITLETCRAVIDEAFIKQHGYGKPGRYAMISVSDTGTGMDEQTRMRIFEPFFTTKELGKGTGLGLSTAYGVMKQNNGYITCYSEPGAGTTFRVYLPIAGSVAPKTDPALRVAAGRGTETVLLAEDDKAMRDLFGTLLEDHGYTVLLAAEGEEAIALFRARARDIGLLVLDVVMPKKSGKEVYDEARRVRPGVKALFISGYTADIVKQKGINEDGLHFLAKPASPDEFLKAVRDVLDGT